MGQVQAANEVPSMYALVTPKRCLIMGATIPDNDNLLSPALTTGCLEDLSWSPADTRPEVPAPDKTILKQIHLLRSASWPLEDYEEAANLLLEFVDMFS